MFLLRFFVLLMPVLFVTEAYGEATIGAARMVASPALYNYKEMEKANPQALAALLNFQGKVEGRDGWIQVYLANPWGQLVPQYVKEEVWNRKKAGCSGALLTPMPENLGNPCRRMVQTYPGMAGANDQLWKFKSDGTVSRQLCPQGTLDSCHWPLPDAPPAQCEHNDHLPKGKTFEKLMQSGMDCLSKEARSSDLIALACNMYFESRGEGEMGKRVVGEITANRTRANKQKGRSVDTIRKVVYEMRGDVAQFSWVTAPSAVVKFPTSGMTDDRKAWYEALYQASFIMDYKRDKFSSMNFAQLPCYTHYLSLERYKSFDEVPNWANEYYTNTKSDAGNKRPVCLGAHIFFRAPELEYGCNPGDRVRDPEAGDKEIPIRLAFYKGCLGLPDMIDPEPSPVIPPNSMCDGNTIQDALCAQTRETPVYGIGGLPRVCTDDSKPTGGQETKL